MVPAYSFTMLYDAPARTRAGRASARAHKDFERTIFGGGYYREEK